MKNQNFFLLIFAWLFLGIACRSPQATSSTNPSLKEGAQQLERLDTESFYWFLELVAEQVELPTAMVQKHTLIAKPYGQFSGVEILAVSDQIQAFVLEQKSALCTNYFLLTTDGNQVIDQRLLAEICDPSPASSQWRYSRYNFLSSNEVLIQHIQEEDTGEEIDILPEEEFVYQISAVGRIERRATMN